MSNTGYIRLSRGYFDSLFWGEKREFSKAEAWLDLIQSARFEPSKVLFKGQAIELQRGEIMAGRRYLEERWGWSNTKIKRFINVLIGEQMVTQKNANGITILTLCNYELYNSTSEMQNAAKTPRKRHKNATETPNIKKEKKVNKRNISIPPSPNGDVPPLVDGGDEVDPIVDAPPDNSQELTTPTEEEKKKLREKEKNKANFEKFQQWILENAPRVSQLEYPFTQAEFERLKKEFTIDQIQNVLGLMHNYKPLFSKSISANLTFRKWMAKPYNNEPTTNHKPVTVVTTTTQSKSERDAQFAEKIASQLANRPH